MAVSVKVDPVALARLLRSPDSQVVRGLGVLANRVRTNAASRAPKRTSQMANRIVTRFDAQRGAWLVGVFDEPQSTIAIYQHEGTRPHPIVGNPILSFEWPKVGGRVFFRSVMHPGTQPNPFLIDALREEVTRF